jgi:hypothetical protein
VLVDTARALIAATIPYALIGGIAVGIHSGAPRSTLGMTIAALVSSGRARVVMTLEGAGFRKTGEFAHSLNFRHPSGEPVQVAFDPAFDAMILRAECFEVGATSVRIATSPIPTKAGSDHRSVENGRGPSSVRTKGRRVVGARLRSVD